MNEEIIKTFLTKMKTQNNRGTAQPYFYVIRTEVEDFAPTDNCDEVKYYWNERSYSSMDEIEKYFVENDYSEDYVISARREVLEYGSRKRWDHRGMFLTETDAENHLKLNHYHYSHNAHTYVEHAWRAPELNNFFRALFDYFNINKLTPNEEK